MENVGTCPRTGTPSLQMSLNLTTPIQVVSQYSAESSRSQSCLQALFTTVIDSLLQVRVCVGFRSCRVCVYMFGLDIGSSAHADDIWAASNFTMPHTFKATAYMPFVLPTLSHWMPVRQKPLHFQLVLSALASLKLLALPLIHNHRLNA